MQSDQKKLSVTDTAPAASPPPHDGAEQPGSTGLRRHVRQLAAEASDAWATCRHGADAEAQMKARHNLSGQ